MRYAHDEMYVNLRISQNAQQRQRENDHGEIAMRRLPYELYGASALMVAALALVVRAWQRERSLAKRVVQREQSLAKRVSSRISGTIRRRAA